MCIFMKAEDACKQVHEILDKLPRWFEPSSNLPEKGIYFFYEEGEITPHTGKRRIVRVGTHGTKPAKKIRSLRQRLTDHYHGNREGSVFRKHLGSALLKAEGASEDRIKEWLRKRKSLFWKEFEQTELKVSELLKSKFFFRVIRVDGEEERRIFEEKIIATLSSCPVCKPSEKWLGRFAWSGKVRRSGLWNSDFIDSVARLTEKELKRLEQLASISFSYHP